MKEATNGSVLREVSCNEGDEQRQGHHHEEWQACDPGHLSYVWDKDVQDRQELR